MHLFHTRPGLQNRACAGFSPPVLRFSAHATTQFSFSGLRPRTVGPSRGRFRVMVIWVFRASLDSRRQTSSAKESCCQGRVLRKVCDAMWYKSFAHVCKCSETFHRKGLPAASLCMSRVTAGCSEFGCVLSTRISRCVLPFRPLCAFPGVWHAGGNSPCFEACHARCACT